MALFNRLFPSRKVAKSDRRCEQDIKPFTFSRTQVRVLLFKECEWRGRRLLYDSFVFDKDSVDSAQSCSNIYKKNGENKIHIQNNTTEEHISDSDGIQYKMMNSDALLLGEMIFGSVAMNYKGMSLKVHILSAPQRLMCTKVYCNPGRRRCQPSETYTSSHGSISSDVPVNASGDLYSSGKSVFYPNTHSYSSNPESSVPYQVSLLNTEDHLSVNWFVNKDDSGFCSELSSHSSIGCSCNNDSTYCFWERDDTNASASNVYHFGNTICQSNIPSSLQWRLSRHLSTTLENSNMPFTSIPGSPNCKDLHIGRNSVSSTSESLSSSGKSIYNKKTKMGLAIVITLTEKIESQMLKFLMEHAILVEGALSRLRIAVCEALCRPQHFLNEMNIATQEAAQWLVDLLTCPRIGTPMWPNLSCSQRIFAKDKMAGLFMNDFCSLLCTMDTKDTYFFMSTLLTNILTYHLGWVNSVSPYNVSASSQQKELDALNNSNPYNPLWAQLGELYGVIGTPSRISKTVIYGKQNVSLVKKILNVLSYFIRCGEVKRLNVETKPVPWDSVDLLVSNHQCEDVAFLLNNVDNDMSETTTGDYIEMRIFSSNQTSVFSKKPRFKDDSKIEINTKNMCNKIELNNKISDSKRLKRPASQACKLIHLEKRSDANISSGASSVNSISTLKMAASEENYTINVNLSDNKCDKNIESNSSKESDINFGDIRTKVNKLCRVPTSAVLYNLNDEYDAKPSISNSDSIANGWITRPNKSMKLDCEKQCKAPENIQERSLIINNDIDKSESTIYSPGVVFVLGEDEILVGLKDLSNKKTNNSNIVDEERISIKEPHKESVETKEKEHIRSKSYPRENTNTPNSKLPDRCSLQPEDCCKRKPQCQHSKYKKHSGVKFEFDKYPQIVTNYMKSKNLELLDRHVIGKPGNLKFDCVELEAGSSIVTVPEDCDTCLSCSFSGQGLQTPSNASELEYTSDIPDQCEFQYAKEKIVPSTATEPIEKKFESKIFVKKKLENTLIVNSGPSDLQHSQKELVHLDRESLGSYINSNQDFLELPMPIMTFSSENNQSPTSGYCSSLLGGVSDHYISDLVLQGGIGGEKGKWEHLLKRDLALQGGTTCLLADVDDWSVRVLGSAGGSAGGMSALVASMLDSLPQMCHAKVPPLECLAYIESKLRELCIRSKALAQLLLHKDFCDMEYLTRTLNLDPNDVPLLLAIASTHSPQVTLKYGISYR